MKHSQLITDYIALKMEEAEATYGDLNTARADVLGRVSGHLISALDDNAAMREIVLEMLVKEVEDWREAKKVQNNPE